MQPTTLDVWLQGYSQLASVSAVLGGFAFTFLAILLTHRARSRLIGCVAALTIVSAACFLIDAFGWSLITTHAASFGRPATGSPAHAALLGRHETLSMALLVGMVSFLAALGLSGWIRSRPLGLASTLVTLVAALVLRTVAAPYFEITFRISVHLSPVAAVVLGTGLAAVAAAAIYLRRRFRTRRDRSPHPDAPLA